MNVFVKTIALNPEYYSPTMLPDPSEQPVGSITLVEFAGAGGVGGKNRTDWNTDPSASNGKKAFAFRATFVGNKVTLLLPNFDLIAVPYRAINE